MQPIVIVAIVANSLFLLFAFVETYQLIRVRKMMQRSIRDMDKARDDMILLGTRLRILGEQDK